MAGGTKPIYGNSENRITPLECGRGLAALIVFFWHFLIAFLPNRSGFFNEFPPENGLIGGLFFIPFNGLAAVSFFFVLSGFVLTFRFFQTEDTFEIARSALKRWPRLTGPVLAATLLSWLCFAFGFYFFSDAGALTGSPYLKQFAYAKQGDHFVPSFAGAAAEGIFTTFFRGDTAYSSNLWTMRPELLGSLMAFSLALVFGALKNQTAILVLSAIMVLIFHFIDTIYAAFVLGVLIAYLYARHKIHISGFAAAAMVTVALFLFGFLFPRGLYRYFTSDFFLMPVESLRTYMHILAAALIVLAILGFQPLYNRLAGKWARALGRISFPLYLVQTTVICSFSSWFFVKFQQIFPHPMLVCADFSATLAIILILSFYLGKFDTLWTAFVNRISRRFINQAK